MVCFRRMIGPCLGFTLNRSDDDDRENGQFFFACEMDGRLKGGDLMT